MKAPEAAIPTLFTSALLSLVVFPACAVLSGFFRDEREFYDSSAMLLIVGAMLIVYGGIQFILTVIHVFQVNYMVKRGKLVFDKANAIHPFYISEMALYWLIFLGLAAWMREVLLIQGVLVFSIPYVICCTASVSIFRYYLKLNNETESDETI